VRPVERDKLIGNAQTLVKYLESEGFISETDATPLLNVVITAKDPCLLPIFHLLVKLEDESLVNEDIFDSPQPIFNTTWFEKKKIRVMNQGLYWLLLPKQTNLFTDLHITEEYLKTCDLHLLVKLAGFGIIEIHDQKNLENLPLEIVGSGGGAIIYKTKINDKTLALKVFAQKKDQEKYFKREIALTRYHIILIQFN
jgi:hypothetical protein